MIDGSELESERRFFIFYVQTAQLFNFITFQHPPFAGPLLNNRCSACSFFKLRSIERFVTPMVLANSAIVINGRS